MSDDTNDPRALLTSAQAWVTDLISGTREDQLDSSTPCTDYDVRALLEHLHAVSAKLQTMAEGGDPRQVPQQRDYDDGPLAQQYAAGAAAAMSAWSPDEMLTTTVTAPFGQVPGAVALAGFVMETTTHGWDLATATGQDPEADPAVAAAAQQVAERALGPGPRPAEVPFDDPVTPGSGAGPTTRLAAYLGRQV